MSVSIRHKKKYFVTFAVVFGKTKGSHKSRQNEILFLSSLSYSKVECVFSVSIC